MFIFIVVAVVYFVIDSVRKPLDTPSCILLGSFKYTRGFHDLLRWNS